MVLFFLGVLFLKAFHLIAKTRVSYLEQVMPVSIATHVRLQSVILTLFVTDLAIAHYCVQSTLSGGSTILILFGFEFGLLVISAFNIMTKYYLHLLDSYLSRGLVGKGLYIMVLEVLCDALFSSGCNQACKPGVLCAVSESISQQSAQSSPLLCTKHYCRLHHQR